MKGMKIFLSVEVVKLLSLSWIVRSGFPDVCNDNMTTMITEVDSGILSMKRLSSES